MIIFWLITFISRAIDGKTELYLAVSCWVAFNSSNLLVMESVCEEDKVEVESLNLEVPVPAFAWYPLSPGNKAVAKPFRLNR